MLKIKEEVMGKLVTIQNRERLKLMYLNRRVEDRIERNVLGINNK